MKRLIVIPVFLGVALATAAVARSVASGVQPSMSAQTPQQVAEQRKLARTKGLESAAKVTGTYVETISFAAGGGPATWSELATLSETVVLGRVLKNVGVLTFNGHSVGTHFTVHVERALKGLPDKTVHVLVPGGRFGFPDGTWAQVNVRNFAPPSDGQSAVWFLRTAPARDLPKDMPSPAYIIAAGPLGLFPLDRSGRKNPYVIPAGGFDSPLSKRLLAARVLPADFLSYLAAELR